MSKWVMIKILIMIVMTGVLFIIAWELTALRIAEEKILKTFISIQKYLKESEIVIETYE